MPHVVPTFHAHVDEHATLRMHDPRDFKRYLGAFKGDDVVVTVIRYSRQRSSQQNRWLWGVALPLIAEHCGVDAHEHERLHYDLLTIRFGTMAVPAVLDDASPRIVPKRTSSDLSTAEFSEFMDWLVQFAAERLDVVIPLPDDATAVHA